MRRRGGSLGDDGDGHCSCGGLDVVEVQRVSRSLVLQPEDHPPGSEHMRRTNEGRMNDEMNMQICTMSH